MKRLWLSGVVCVLFMLQMDVVEAGYITLNGVGTRAGSLNGGFSSIAYDAAAVFYNPAALTELEGTNFELGTTYYFPRLKHIDNTNVLHESDKWVSGFAPHFFVSTHIFKSLALGFGSYQPFALENNWIDHPTAAQWDPARMRIIKNDFTIAAGYKLFSFLSLGGGFTASLGRYDAQQTTGGANTTLTEEAVGHGIGGHVSVHIKPVKFLEIGAGYFTEQTLDYAGRGSTGPNAALRETFKMKLRFPMFAFLGVSLLPLDNLSINGGAGWVKLSQLTGIRRQYLESNINDFFSILNQRAVIEPGAGIEWKPWKTTALRASYLYSPIAVDTPNVSPMFPDTKSYKWGAGFTYTFKNNFDLNLGYNYIRGKSRAIEGSLNPTYNGTYSSSTHLAHFGIAYKFI